MMDLFSGQKVIVTGATRGIGKAISSAFLEQGAYVFGIYGRNSKAADQFKAECSANNRDVSLFCCDVSDELSVKSFFKQVEADHSSIDILINCAGIRQDALTPLMKQEQWQSVIDVNLTGTFNMCRSAVPLMLKQKYGRIINITSPVSYLGFQGQANYAASKAGQIGLTKTLAKETARKKITVNCVSPGFIDTDFINDLPEDQLRSYKKMVPMRRFGKVEEVSSTVLFLASPQASYITGAVLEVTGGL
jgi:3-oxoacyl-[acyl-carrier protein] reductase